jgi:hypothetical protein
MSFLRGFDAFSKSKKDVQVKTLSGATISLTAIVIMGVLFISELVYWRTTRTEDHIVVDKSLGDRDVDIDIDLHFHQLQCSRECATRGARGVGLGGLSEAFTTHLQHAPSPFVLPFYPPPFFYPPSPPPHPAPHAPPHIPSQQR